MKSDLQACEFLKKSFFVKRDDKLGELNGNKARKLAKLLKTPPKRGSTLVSYGSNQSNAMLAISIFAKRHDLCFKYVSRPVCKYLLANPSGNLKLALENGMNLYECDGDLDQRAASLLENKDIFLPQGLSYMDASIGLYQLACELLEHLATFKDKDDFAIYLPAGTGCSAYFLSKYIKLPVFTLACVGKISYLKKQLYKLDKNADFKNLFFIRPARKWHFAKPYEEFIRLYHELLEKLGFSFELLYDMPALYTLFYTQSELSSYLDKGRLIYIHQGGLEGNESMLKRYKYKFSSLFKL